MSIRKSLSLAVATLFLAIPLLLSGCGVGASAYSTNNFNPGPWEPERLDNHLHQLNLTRFEEGNYKYQHIHISLEHECNGYVLQRVESLSNRFNIPFTLEDFHFTVDYFSWLDFITPQQFEIARNYLKQDPHILETFNMTPENFHFRDEMVSAFIGNMIGAFTNRSYESLRYYANTPIENMPYNPQRILVQMHEAELIMAFEEFPYLPDGTRVPRYVAAFGREVTDWR